MTRISKTIIRCFSGRYKPPDRFPALATSASPTSLTRAPRRTAARSLASSAHPHDIPRNTETEYERNSADIKPTESRHFRRRRRARDPLLRLSKEPTAIARVALRQTWGSALLARRIIEHGTKFVTNVTGPQHMVIRTRPISDRLKKTSSFRRWEASLPTLARRLSPSDGS